MDTQRFENLGRNCEIGFALEWKDLQHGRKGQGSLFRWALVSAKALSSALRSDFEGFYQLENLEPAHKTMVRDRATDIKLHSKMVREFKFVENHADFYAAEMNKRQKLLARLRLRLTSPNTIFLRTAGAMETVDDMEQLAEAVRFRGPAKLIWLTPDSDDPVGHVRHHKDNMYIASMDRLADPVDTKDFSRDAFDAVFRNGLSAIPPTPWEPDPALVDAVLQYADGAT